ncbi:hypothetical protein [Arsenicicoccus piscis]|uniref:Uncharacterized protein n=1 Tax=Arsenicicoccus piscis TaxID=673954 RepID=A0ABQ6HU29_9MICO|nr:hypothetical protein GCM10025862_38360 [Arsenicicoccus piscis]
MDSGFIVHNDRTYPLLQRLFAELEVPTRATEMSMSITDAASGIAYAGGKGVRGSSHGHASWLDPTSCGCS